MCVTAATSAPFCVTMMDITSSTLYVVSVVGTDRPDLGKIRSPEEAMAASTVDVESGMFEVVTPRRPMMPDDEAVQGSQLALFGRHLTVFGALSESPAPNY